MLHGRPYVDIPYWHWLPDGLALFPGAGGGAAECECKQNYSQTHLVYLEVIFSIIDYLNFLHNENNSVKPIFPHMFYFRNSWFSDFLP